MLLKLPLYHFGKIKYLFVVYSKGKDALSLSAREKIMSVGGEEAVGKHAFHVRI